MSSPSRRDLLRGVGIAGVSLAAGAGLSQAITSRPGDHVGASRVSFRGVHQSGITTPAPDYLSLIAFDLDVESATDIRDLLNAWSAVVADLVAGRPVGPEQSPSLSPRDTGEALELGASSLTVTIGYGPSLFERPDTSHLPRPRHLAPLPTFVGDNLDNRLGGGDVVFQICSQDAQVNFHAVHSLERLAQGLAHLRYWHRGFGRTSAVGGKQESTRNLLGFKDGTNNLQSHHVLWLTWCGSEMVANHHGFSTARISFTERFGLSLRRGPRNLWTLRRPPSDDSAPAAHRSRESTSTTPPT